MKKIPTYRAIREKMAALAYQIKCAKTLQQFHPEIAGDYRQGLTHGSIADKYRLCEKYNVERNTAKLIVKFAILGNDNEKVGDFFSGLIPRKELEDISREHLRKSGLNSSLITRVLDEEKRVDLGKWGRKGIEAQGKTEWTEDEDISLLSMMEDENYMRGNTTARARMAKELNKKHHKGEAIRTPDAISHRIKKLK